MKKIKKLIFMLLAAVLVFTVLPETAKAATVEVYAGNTVEVKIPVKEGYGGDGTITLSNEGIIESCTISGSGELGLFVENNKTISFTNSTEIKNGFIKVTLKIKASAKVGDTCVVSVSGYAMVNEDFESVPATLEAQTVVVKAKPAPTPTPEPEPEPVDPTDYAELNKQIEIAESLNASGYTKESWGAFTEALANAKAAVGCKNQTQVDNATQALRAAISGLTPVNYSALQDAINAGENMMQTDELSRLFEKLVQAIMNGKNLMGSDDQAAVDAATAEILDYIEQIRIVLEAQKEENKENNKGDVSTEPSGDYCNIGIHKVWPILFVVSLAANGVLVLLLVDKKQKKERLVDDTPVVDYEIGDDE